MDTGTAPEELFGIPLASCKFCNSKAVFVAHVISRGCSANSYFFCRRSVNEPVMSSYDDEKVQYNVLEFGNMNGLEDSSSQATLTE